MPEVGPKTVERFDRLAETSSRAALPDLRCPGCRSSGGRQGVRGTFGDAMTFKLGSDDVNGRAR
jgi:hypothetical protein